MRDLTAEFNQKLSVMRSGVRVQTPVSESEASIFVEVFLIKVEDVINMFTATDRKIKDVTDLQVSLLAFGSFGESNEALFTSYEGVKRDFIKISAKIEALGKSFDIRTFTGNNAEAKICTTQLSILRKKLNTSVGNYYNIQDEYKTKCKERVIRQARICGVDESKIDLDQAVASKTNFFIETIFPDYNVAHTTVNEIKKRHEELLRLERSIEELRNLMFDCRLVISTHVEYISRLDRHTQIIERSVHDGVQSTKAYRRAQKTHRYKYYIAFCCCGVVSFIVVVSALAAFA